MAGPLMSSSFQDVARHRKVSMELSDLSAPHTGRSRCSRGCEARQSRSEAGGRVHHGQRRLCRPRPESCATGLHSSADSLPK